MSVTATLFRITETLRLEKASKIIKSNLECAKLEQQGYKGMQQLIPSRLLNNTSHFKKERDDIP